LKLKIKTILIFTLLGGLLSFVICEYLIPKRYTSSVVMYSYFQHDSDDIFTPYMTLNDIYNVIIRSDLVLGKVAEEVKRISKYNLYYTISELKSFIKVKPVKSTKLFEILVTTENREYSKLTADAIAEVVKIEIPKIVKEKENIEIVDLATLPDKPSYPDIPLFTLLGALISFVLSLLIMVKSTKRQAKSM